MKKIVSIVLCLMLLISSFPMIGFSAENSDVKQTEAQSDETIKKPSDDGYVRHMREEQGAEKELSLMELDRANEPGDENESEGDLTLMASTGTMKVKVTFPSGTTTKKGDVVYVYLYTPATVEDGRVVSEPVWYKSESATLTGNVDSVTISLTSVAYGNYIIATKLISGNKNVLSNMQYYSSNGTVIDVPGAEKVKLSSSSKTVTLPLLKAESSVSGTIDLSACVPQADTTITVSSTIEDGILYNYQYISIPVKSGDRSVKYEMGVSNGNQYVRFSSEFIKSGYFFDGQINSTWNKRTFFNLQSQHKTNLDVVASSASTSAQYDYYITLTLPYTPVDQEFFCGLTDGNDVLAEEWVYFEETNTVTIGLSPYDYSDEIYFFYKDINPYDGASYEIDESMRFYSEDKGVTGNIDYATNIVDMDEITVKYPDSYTISGNINTETGIAGDAYVYIGAEFEDDIYYTYVPESSGSYKIYVPKSLKNQEYTIFTASGSYGCMIPDSKEYGSSYTLSGNKTGLNVTAPGSRKISGIIELPCPAPKSGMNVSFDYVDYSDDHYGYAGMCYIAPGETEAQYSVFVPATLSSDGCLEVRADTKEAVNISQYTNSMGLEDEEDVWFDETVTISGKVSLPSSQSSLDTSLTFEISAESGYNWAYGYITILKGESCAYYSLNVPKNSTLTSLNISHQRNDVSIGRDYYYSSSGTLVPTWTRINIYVSADKEINLKFPETVAMSGTITLPENGTYHSGDISYTITCENVSSGIEYSQNYTITTPFAENVFSIPVSEEDEYIISVCVNDTGNSSILDYIDYYYVSDSLMSSSKSEASYIYPGEEVKLTFPVCDTVSGTIKFAEGCYIEGEGIDIGVYAKSVNTGYYYDCRLEDIDTTTPVNFSIKIPGGNDERFIVYAYVMYDDDETKTNIELYTDIYYSSDGMVKNEYDADEVTSSSNIEIIIPKYREITGKIVVPTDYKYVTPLSRIEYVLISEDSYYYYLHGYVDEDLNYVVYITDNYIENGNYMVYTYINDIQQNNILKDESYYYKDSSGNNKFITITDNGDVSGVDIKVETGWAISGTVYLPEDAVRENTAINVHVYGDLNYWYGGESGEISEDDNCLEYMFAVEKEPSRFPVWAEVETYEQDYDRPYITNISEAYMYYKSATASTWDSEEATYITVNGDVSGIDIYLATGCTFNINLKYPTFAESTLYGYVYLVDERGEEVEEGYFNLSRYDETSLLNMVVSKSYMGKKLYLYVETYSYGEDPLYSSKVYINPDGTLAFSKVSATPFIIGETNEASYTPIKDDDSRIPTYEIESDHPYLPDTRQTYTYNHPDSSVSKLYVTFNELSELSYGDSIYVYDTYGNYVTDFSNYDYISSETFVVYDSGFTIVFESNNYSESYGFAIESIEENKTYTVVFKNYDGTVLKTYTVNHGDSVYYDGPKPTKPAKPMHICEFTGWDEYTYNIESDMVITAQFYEDAMYYIYFAGSEWLEEDPYNVYVENCTGEDRKACYVVANYSADGKLVDVELEEIDFYAYENPVRNTGAPISEDGYVKVMLFDSIENLLPIAAYDIAY